MNEDELKSLMKSTRPPDPYPAARRTAIAAAQQAFREKMLTEANSFQGSSDDDRPDGEAAVRAVIANREVKMQKRINFRMPVMTLAVLVIVGSASWMALTGVRPVNETRRAAEAGSTITPLQADRGTPDYSAAKIADNQLAASVALGASPVTEMPVIDQNKTANGAFAPQMAADDAMPVAVGQSVDLADTTQKKAEAPMTRAETDSLKSPALPPNTPIPPASAPGVTADAAITGKVQISSELPESYYQDAGRDKFEPMTENSVKEVAQEPVSTFSVDVDTASYSFVRRSLNEGRLPQKDAVRVEEMINYFDYGYALPEDRAQPFQPSVTLIPAPWNTHHLLMHVGIKGYDLPKEARPKANLVFLIDVSGSMDEPTKLPLAKNALKMLVETMKPEDTVAIVTYAGTTGVALAPTAISDKAKILQVIDGLQAGGGTAGAAGIQLAYGLTDSSFVKDGVNRVILATDGDFNIGITDNDELKSAIERERNKGVYLSVLGFGMGNYNDATMQTLAQNGNGNAAYIDSLNEARRVLVDEASSTLFPIAKDVKIQIEFNPKMVAEYRLIGYETRMLTRQDFNNDKVDAGDVGAGHAVTALYEITPQGVGGTLDPLRYATAKAPVDDKADGGEFAFLKIRYKLPIEDASKLIQRPITINDKIADASKASDDVRFAASVAAFGQLLRGGKFTGRFSYDEIIALANNARGSDAFGQRSEFVNTVRLAKALQSGSLQ